jgi:putative DNA primase/helicase
MTISAGMAKVTPATMLDLMSQSADWKKFDGRSKKEVAIDPPAVVAGIIVSRVGQWTVPSVAGVITTPTMRPDGTILHQPGYDPVTRLYQVVDPTLIPSYIPDQPTGEDAQAALAVLNELLDEFPFVADVDRSVALSAIITPIVRGAVSVAPLHAIRASTAGTGKSYLADTASAIATGRPCPVIAVSGKPEETESRLVGLLLAAFPLISLDNVNGELGGDLLCQAVERPTVRVRRLGGSDIFEIESRATFYATGNGLRVRGDMTRRTVICNLDAGVERPEERQFTHSPVEDVLADRGRYVAAALTIVRAYIVAGSPGRLPRLASFEEWSDVVRSALVWLGQPDPVETTAEAREDDPDMIQHRDIVTTWADVIGKDSPKTVKQMVEIANQRQSNEYGDPGEYRSSEFRDALLSVASIRGEINKNTLGNYLRAKEGRISNRLRIRKAGEDSHSHGILWKIV